MNNFLWFLVVVLILALALPGCATKGTASAMSDGTMTVTVSAARVANCKANGGCGLYSRNELLQMIDAALEEGARQVCPARSKVLL